MPELNTQKTEDKTLYLVDGSAYIFRAYHALPPLTNPEGVPVGAVLGFTTMLARLLQENHAHHIAVIFDAARKNFRNDIYADYKANRDAPPEDLVPQFPLIREATKAFGLDPLEMEGFEADDLIATYARLASQQGRKTVIVSSDKDLMQLVNDHVSMLDPMKNKLMSTAEVIEKFGVTPDKVVDVQALAGDSIDNVPGVPGIGVKTAAQLINEYGDLETLLERAEEIKQPKRRESLIEFADQARISKQLVSLDAQVNVPITIDNLTAHDLDSDDLRAFLTLHGFKSVMTRLGQKPAVTAVNANTSEKSNDNFPPITDNEYTLITDGAALQKWMDDARTAGHICFDTETNSLTPAKADLVGISIAIHPGKAAYIPLGHQSAPVDLLDFDAQDNGFDQIPMDEVTAIIKPVFEDPSILKIAQNAKYDIQMLAHLGITVAPCDDTMLISYAIGGGKHGHGMDDLARLYLDHTPIAYKDVVGTGKSQVTFDMVTPDKALDYAAEDADITLRLWHILKARMVKERCISVYEDFERPLVDVVARMESTGIVLDRGFLNELSTDFAKGLSALEHEIHDLAGSPFNIASPKQVGQILFDQMGLQGGKKTKTGDWSTSVSVLEELSHDNPIVAKILEARQLAKLKSTYTDALQNQINPKTGRVHTSFSLAGTSTGRLASSDPNLQNIPIRTEEGRKIRRAFIAPEGHSLLSVDYSQVELRLVAHMANIPAMKDAFAHGVDIHAMTASEVFGVPLDQMDGETRRKAKAINFGIVYGISGFGLARQLGIETPEASDYIKRYFARFPELAQYMEVTKDEAHANGYVKTLDGRRCWIRGINDKNHAVKSGAERAAINAPIQGTAADIMKRAMIAVDRAIQNGEIAAKMLLQVHDELIFEVADDKLETVAKQVKQIMEDAAPEGIPLVADAGFGKNWGEAH